LITSPFCSSPLRLGAECVIDQDLVVVLLDLRRRLIDGWSIRDDFCRCP
jgi:hypothetical protein